MKEPITKNRPSCHPPAKVSKNIEGVTVVTLVNERQSRPLMGLTPEQQREAWVRAMEKAGDDTPKGWQVTQVVKEMKKEEEPSSKEPAAAEKLEAAATKFLGRVVRSRRSFPSSRKILRATSRYQRNSLISCWKSSRPCISAWRISSRSSARNRKRTYRTMRRRQRREPSTSSRPSFTPHRNSCYPIGKS